ncbi:hypothetical protein CEXT_358951 [Caerostris extrusa]|uniref:Recombination activating protein 1 n=1 Tax=Caerostris extrusa TaxID=172846 RepID=A0AAV4TL04_CAEEX|nr:hypothetical protein CEXT_358951 [Caerostris extrusa]
MNDGQSSTSMISSNDNYFKSSKSINELVLRTRYDPGNFLPDAIKIWFTNQKIRQFVDIVRQCLHCYEFTHATRVCNKKICPRCGVNREGLCQGPENASIVMDLIQQLQKSAHVIYLNKNTLVQVQKSSNYWRGKTFICSIIEN